jgi:hypothetical protein
MEGDTDLAVHRINGIELVGHGMIKALLHACDVGISSVYA